MTRAADAGAGVGSDLTRGYVSGPAAATEPRRLSLELVATAQRLVLVEGVTDQIVLERLAARTDRELIGEGIVIAPMGGAHAIDTFLEAVARRGRPGVTVGGMCDRREAAVFRAALTRAGHGPVADDAAMARLGFHVCDADLEDELIRALGAERVEGLLDDHDDLGSFRTLQQQTPWRGRPVEAQLHRFLRSRARRMHRYGIAMVDAIDLDDLPAPLVGAIAAVGDVRTG